MKLSQIIAETIRLAQAVPAPQVESCESHRWLVWGDERATDPRLAPELDQLRTFLRRQTVGVIIALNGLMYLGRDGKREERFDFLQWYTWVSDIFDQPGDARDAVVVLLSKLPLPDYLERGLAALAAEGLDVDELLGSM